MFIVGKENTEMDVKNEGGNLLMWPKQFQSLCPHILHAPSPQAGCLPFAEGECRGCPPRMEPFPRRQGGEGTKDA